ncbi:MAG: hypothetical protein HY913_02000 [Desulfomonile tiedjei]|nr:hypothetical protein [Desulfomonile tiedjei]
MLNIKFTDILRATLPIRCGNEGWIGVSPKGDDYHVVVPVDVQIARGVLACNRPSDGTPFGGYARWLYFRCPPYDDEGKDDSVERVGQARKTGEELVRWLASYGIDAECRPDASIPNSAARANSMFEHA